MEGLIVVQHPVLEDRLAVLRDAATPHGAFRLALHEASGILAIEATRDLPTVERSIESPLEPVEVRRLEAPIIIVPVLRAGHGRGLPAPARRRARRAPGPSARRGHARADGLLRAPPAGHGRGPRVPA